MSDHSKDQANSGRAPLDATPWGVLVAVVLLAVIFWLVMTSRVPEPASHPAVGRPAPTFDLVQLIPQQAQPAERTEEDEGPAAGTPNMLSGLPPAGAVTLLHIWGTWCPPCKLEYPELVAMVREIESDPQFHFISVSCGTGGREDYQSLQSQTAGYYQSIGAGELETYADLDGQTRRSVAEQLGDSVVYPTTILISANQRIAAVWLGYSPAGVSEMRRVAEELLEQAQQ